MWGYAAWQVYTRQKMGYDFAVIGARQRCGETPGQERHWNRAAAYYRGEKFFLTFTNIYSIMWAGWNTAIEYLCSRFAYAEPMIDYHWDYPSTVRGLPSDRRNSACVVGILRCFYFTTKLKRWILAVENRAAWQVNTRQKMGYDFARIWARQRSSEIPGQERHWNRAVRRWYICEA